jgi:hypothetical protein
MTFGEYVVGLLLVGVSVGSVALGAVAVRARLLADWTGAPARVAEAVIAVGALLIASEVVGSIGAFRRVPLLVACVALGLGLVAVGRSRGAGDDSAPSAPVPSRPELGAAAAASTLILAQWGTGAVDALRHGMLGSDTLRYHGPIAARFVQEGAIDSLHFVSTDAVVAYLPFNSELLHGVGILLLGNDLLSPLLNLVWLGLALVSAWSIGRPARLGLITLMGAGLVLGSPALANSQPGTGDSDIFAAAFALAALALLVNGGLRPAPLAVAGLAAGVAAGGKLTVVAALATLTAGIPLLAGRGRRLRATVLWLVPLALTGGFWYVRNLVHADNPFPWFGLDLGPLSLPDVPRPPSESIAHYATDFTIWREFFRPGLDGALGPLWWAVIAMSLAGAAVSVIRGRTPLVRWLGVVGVVALAGYVLTPGTAAGPEGLPVAFSFTVRYAALPLAIGLVLLPLLPGAEAIARKPGSAIALGLALLVTVSSAGLVGEDSFPVVAGAGAVVLVAAGTVVALHATAGRRPAAMAGSGLALILVLGAGWLVQRDYLRDRYAEGSFAWAQPLRDARIALAGSTRQYQLYGRDLSNRVEYVGRRLADGGYGLVRSCRDWRRALNGGRYDYVVAAAGDFLGGVSQELPREVAWTGADPAASPLLTRGELTVFRLRDRLDLRSPCRWRNPSDRRPAAVIAARLDAVSRCLRRRGLSPRRALTPGSSGYSARAVPLSGSTKAIVYAFASPLTAAQEGPRIIAYLRAGTGSAERFGPLVIGYVGRASTTQKELVEACAVR